MPMRLATAARHFAQLCFDFVESHTSPAREPVGTVRSDETKMNEEADEPAEAREETADEAEERMRKGRDDELEGDCRQLLLNLGIKAATELVSVHWNPRLRSTAGYAAFPSWRIELNPRLIGFEGQVERTLKHELAHLVAYFRAGRRRIEPHGQEWRQACADLGIPGEPAHHRLPFPRSTMQRNHTYQCPSCGVQVGRVRPFKRATACIVCCRKHSRGAFDARFKFVKVPTKD
ncbi:MAG: Acidic repeat-containing protein [Verrucomicrobiaceae bacterium]|nr:Acidic repeat-containing protein [Verrucomicrobiaceae bacterium]